MAINLESVKKTPGVSEKKVQKTYDELVKVFQKNKLNVKEILIVLGNLIYTLGASVGGYKDKGPSPTKLQELYLLKPTIDVALMINGLNVCAWQEDLEKKIEDIIKEEQEKKDGSPTESRIAAQLK